MTTAHTPGPWMYCERGAHPHPFICGAPESTEWGPESFVVAYLVGANVKANATLIAAAPAMLAALRLAEKTLLDATPSDRESGIACLEQIRAAIAKATAA